MFRLTKALATDLHNLFLTIALIFSMDSSDAENNKTETRTLLISANTQQEFHDLRIASGNIWTELFKTPDGVEHNELRAGLWVFVRDKPPLNLKQRVHVGQVIKIAAKYKIKILGIKETGIELMATYQ